MYPDIDPDCDRKQLQPDADENALDRDHLREHLKAVLCVDLPKLDLLANSQARNFML